MDSIELAQYRAEKCDFDCKKGGEFAHMKPRVLMRFQTREKTLSIKPNHLQFFRGVYSLDKFPSHG